MKPFTVLLSFIFITSSNGLSSKSILPADCNATFPAAEKALDWINKVQEEGYILSLFRIADVHEQPVINGTIYYLKMDVVETKCPRVSKKHWLDCQIRPFFLTMFGQCKAIIYLSNDWSIIQLYSYDCRISSAPHHLIISMCADCPTIIEDGHEDAFFRDKAEEGLEIYNRENNFTHYFKLDKIERVSVQMVDKQLHVIEFTITETTCSKSLSALNISKCQFLEKDPIVGFCIANVDTTRNVTVSCEIFDPEEDHPTDPRHCPRGGHRHGHRHKHRHGHEHGHRHKTSHRKGHRHHPHPHHHHHPHPHPHHHHHHHPHPHPHHHHHHHHHHPHHNEQNNSWHHHEHKHECRPPHRGPPPGHGHQHPYYNRSHGSSSEEHTPIQVPCLPRRPSGEIMYVSLLKEDQPRLLGSSGATEGLSELPGPGQSGANLPPCEVPPTEPFPLTHSDSESCPGQPREHMPEILHLFLK